MYTCWPACRGLLDRPLTPQSPALAYSVLERVCEHSPYVHLCAPPGYSHPASSCSSQVFARQLGRVLRPSRRSLVSSRLAAVRRCLLLVIGTSYRVAVSRAFWACICVAREHHTHQQSWPGSMPASAPDMRSPCTYQILP